MCALVSGIRNNRVEKNSTPVAIPQTLDMAPHVVGPQKNGPLVYELFAVSHHFGALGGGHYIATVKHNDQWYTLKCDDSTVSPVDGGHVDPESAYALFYRRVTGGGTEAEGGGSGAGCETPITTETTQGGSTK